MYLLLAVAHGYNNGLGRKPNMGWNPWNSFYCNVNETLIKASGDKLIETGLAAKGYVVVNLDDCWAERDRLPNGSIVVSAKAFPSGLKSLGDYLHSKNLKFGIYSASTYRTCQFQPGGLGSEEQDANDYASWGVDFLKYDDCNGYAGYTYLQKYKRMGDALNKTGRPIFYSMTSGGNLIEMIGSANIRNIANSWCNFDTGDFLDNWQSFVDHLDVEIGQENFGGPYGWNNPDMLQVGNKGMTDDEYQTHFALWSLLKAPLVIGCDIRNMSARTLQTLGNEEVIAINQDDLGRPGQHIRRVKNATHEFDIWGGKLANDQHVVLLFNRLNSTSNVSFQMSDLGLKAAKGKMRDLINKADLGPTQESYMTELKAHCVSMIRLSGLF